MKLPLVFTFLIFEGSYWHPIRFGGWSFGIEDLLCLFYLGSLSSSAAFLPFLKQVSADLVISRILKRGLFWGCTGLSIFLILWMSAMDPHTSVLMSYFTVLVLLLFQRHDLWPISLSGFLIVGPAYGLWVKACLLIWPEFVLQWNLDAFWGAKIIGIPAGELAYGFTLGACYPLGVAYCCDVRLGRESCEKSQSGSG